MVADMAGKLEYIHRWTRNRSTARVLAVFAGIMWFTIGIMTWNYSADWVPVPLWLGSFFVFGGITTIVSCWYWQAFPAGVAFWVTGAALRSWALFSQIGFGTFFEATAQAAGRVVNSVAWFDVDWGDGVSPQQASFAIGAMNWAIMSILVLRTWPYVWHRLHGDDRGE